MDAALQHMFKLGAGAGADRLDAAALVAEHDRALPRPADIDHLVDARAAVGALLPGLGLDRGRIGQFVVQLQKHLLAGHFSRQPAFRRVGQLVLGKQPWPGRHHRCEMLLQIVDPIPGQT